MNDDQSNIFHPTKIEIDQTRLINNLKTIKHYVNNIGCNNIGDIHANYTDANRPSVNIVDLNNTITSSIYLDDTSNADKSNLNTNLLDADIGISNNINNKQINNKNNHQTIKVCLAVKSNAYGHGIELIGKIANDYVDYFGVSCIAEAIILRLNQVNKPILCFGAIYDEQIIYAINNDIEMTISSIVKAENAIKAIKKIQQDHVRFVKKRLNVHIKIDTGMNRVGVRATSAVALIDYVLANSKYLDLVGIYSHFANSDNPNNSFYHEFTLNQIEVFRQIAIYAKNKKNNIIVHLANSGGICNYPNSYFDMVRPGIMAYGYMQNQNLFNKLAPCFSLKSIVAYFKVVLKGSYISYGSTFMAKEDIRVATIPIGYGDGYRRCLSNNFYVLIHGRKCDIIGTICMDMLMVIIPNDLTVNIQDEVTIIGKNQLEEIKIEDLAKKCNTIVYEILSGFTDRIPRVINCNKLDC